MQLSHQLHRYWVNRTVNYSILILITLLGVVFFTWYHHLHTWLTPLILGVIAGALAETDDGFMGRLKALLLTFICFAIASFSIELLFNTPWLFALGLFLSTFSFIMLGAIGPRYASIAFASLLIAIYTMLGVDQNHTLWQQPLLLLTGTAWYYLISLLWQIIWPMQPVQQSLAHVFTQLSLYLEHKQWMFYPTTITNQATGRSIINSASALNVTHHSCQQIEEASLNALIIEALNNCKETLLHRSKRGYIDGPSNRFLKLYFLAQDVHERLTSSHYRYQQLSAQFSHSDILFRFKHLLSQQAKACQDIADAIRLGHQYRHSNDSILALDELHNSLTYLRQQSQQPPHLIAQLTSLFDNLAMVEKQLTNVSNPDVYRSYTDSNNIMDTSNHTNGSNTFSFKEDDNALSDTSAHTPTVMWARIKTHLHTDSMLFRHAIRMAIALTTGYALIQGFDMERGYWILLTTLFVCQPNYSATKKKLTARIIGTLTGLLLGAGLLILFPSQPSQLFFIVLSGVLFFAFRINNYGFATTFITCLVIFCFNQLGEGYAVIMPRFTDTLIGCFLAVMAVISIFPDWKMKNLNQVFANAIAANRDYLEQIIEQYKHGKKDSLQYRVARRDAHEKDAHLSVTMSNMLVEPEKYHLTVEDGVRFLTLNHTLLSYISALGAHRAQLPEGGMHPLLTTVYPDILQQLSELQQILLHQHDTGCSPVHPITMPEYDKHGHDKQELDSITIQQNNGQELDKISYQWHNTEHNESNESRIISQQLQLIYHILPELRSLACISHVTR